MIELGIAPFGAHPCPDSAMQMLLLLRRRERDFEEKLRMWTYAPRAAVAMT
jgi:hypothetical protein